MTTQYNVDERVIETLIPYMLLHYPSFKQLKKDVLVGTRLEACVIQQGHPVSDLLAWSSHLTCYTKTNMQPHPIKATDSTIEITKHPKSTSSFIDLTVNQGQPKARISCLDD